MLAPRKKLWSTPSSAIDVALDFAHPLDYHDVVYDVGCGDGRVLIQMASRSVPRSDSDDDRANYCDNDTDNNNSTATSQQSPPTHQHYCKQFIGIEISTERAEEARSNIRHAQESNQIPSHVSIEIICANALDTGSIDYSKATVIFLYLVPRGLRLIKPIIWPKEEEVALLDNHDDSEMETPLSEKRVQQKSNNRCSRRVITYMSPFEDEEYVRKELCRVDHQVGAAWPVYLYHIK